MLIIYTCLAIAGLLGLDQLFKLLAWQTIRLGGDVGIIPDVLVLKYRENTGAAFSILEGHTWILSLVTAVVIGIGLFFLLSKRIKDPFFHWGITAIVAGGMGNLVDRIFRGFVIDYIYFKPIDFPIFNFADILVVCGEIFLIIYVLFFYERFHGRTLNGAN